ncbi:Proteophosphoglycan ppg4 [Rhodotorula toruloides ATCC 204091]|uniref:Proteophosphoglycan ppg4 n=1 Tax=Rhodotorula toruloides TaxID=5286 RepID=A0A0K3CD34_RHOTO|nr:Proteophosphoglycan ppg4 [Rhodotorula toruloides ATCC 204091]KAK4333834.1 Proteophosphoglycan ppg4 [Rhodotorula toruloides]PRQ76628.1 Proteophosphoglycan ppg4 [Rhodotorula toruloides]
MNAHHKKASYRPPPPSDRSRYSAGELFVPGKVEEGEYGSALTRARLGKAVERIPFGWQLEAILPSTASSASVALATALEEVSQASGSYCLCEGVNLGDLLTPDFLNSFVRSDSLVALSLDDAEDADVVCIDGRGRLVLSLTKDTYELLGLPGRASAYGTLRQRFVVEISLADPAFRAGKPGFERVKRALANWPERTNLLDELGGQPAERPSKRFDLLMSYVDDQGQPRPVSLPNSTCHSLRPSFTSHIISSISVPKAASFPPATPPSSAKKPRTSSGAFRPSLDGDDPTAFWETYREWAGLAALGGGAADKLRWSNEAEEDEWGVEREKCEEGEVQVLRWEGLLHPKAVLSVIERLSRHPDLAKHPFISLTLRPFPHAPLSHTSAAAVPVVGTSNRPNGKKRKRGRGRGEEEEADRERVEDQGGWEMVLVPRGEGKLDWHLWEGQ